MSSLLAVSLTISLLSSALATFTQQSGLLPSSEDKELKSLIKHFRYLESVDAKPIDREDLIQNGFAKSSENFHYPDKPLSASNEFDCKIRKLAYEFSKKLSPGRGAGEELKYIFDGLELRSYCNVTFHGDMRKNLNIADDKMNSATDHSTLDIFVDGANGKVSSDGSYTKPLSNIQSGINRCSSKRADSTVKCRIFIRSGVYHVTEPLTIKDNNIMLLAYQDEDVKVSSDVIIEPVWKLYKSSMESYKGFNPIFEGIKPQQTTKVVIFVGVLKDSVMCEKKCASERRCTAYVYFDKTTANFTNQCYMRVDGRWNTLSHSGVISGKKVSIYSTDLSKYNLHKVDSVFINDRRAVRARYPNANPETMGLHTVPSGYVRNADKWLPPRTFPDATLLHIKSPVRSATLFPDFYLGFGGPVYQFDPAQSYWATKNPVGGAATTYMVPSGLQYSQDLEMSQRSWKKASTGIVHAYQHYHWGNWMFQLDSRNESTKTLHWTLGGFQEARGSKAGKEWYVENIFEELDVANEWFYDEEVKLLYYSPNITAGDLPTKLAIPQLACLCEIVGAESHPVSNTVVRGITFQHTTKTFLEAYTVPSGGDWSVHRNAMVYIEGTKNTLVEKCVFDSPEGNGLMVSKYNRGTTISRNFFYRLGDNGIVLIGDSHMIDGTQGDQPRGVRVLHNVVLENGIWGKQTYPYVQSRSCESYLEGNVFFNGPRAGININDGFGGGNTINSNLLFNFVRETDDHGPINTWDRVPYLTKLYDGKLSLNIKENQIHYNFIINNYRSVWPIDHDDGTSFWNDTHNYLVYGGFKNYLGHDKHSMHNVYVYPDKHGGKGASFSYPYCMQTSGQTLGTSGYGDVYMHNKCIIGKSDLFSTGNCKATFMKELIPFLAENNYYTPKGEFVVHCGGDTWNFKEFQWRGMEMGTVVEDLVSDDVVIKWGRDLLNIH